MNICKMGRFWLQTYQPTLIIELNFNIPRNQITDYSSKVPSVNEMGTYIMYNRERERGGGIKVHNLEKSQEIRKC